MSQPKVSVCILSFNRITLLHHSLQRMSHDLDYPKSSLEFLVIDNGSADATVSMLQQFFPKVKLFPLNQNDGITSWNTLIEAATGDYILLLDDDAYLTDDNLSAAVKVLDQNPKAAALAIRAINPKGNIDFNYAYPTGVLSYWGCSALFKAPILKELKGYDPSFFFQAFELDLSLRLKERGYEILFSPQIWGIHLTEPNYQPNGFKFYVSRRNLIYVVQKHFTGLLKYKLLFRLFLMTYIQGRHFNLKTPLKAIFHGFFKGRKLTKQPVSKKLQQLYADDFSEFQAISTQRIMWKNRDFWLQRKESYPNLNAPFPEIKTYPNQLLIFLHRLNMDGATHVVLKMLSRSSFFESFGNLTVVSTLDGPLREHFEGLGVSVRIIPYAAHLHEHGPFSNALKYELEHLIKQSQFVWINTLDHSTSLFKLIDQCDASVFIFGHESLAPDSPVVGDIGIYHEQQEVLRRLAKKSNISFGFPSTSTSEYANHFFQTKTVSVVPLGIEPFKKPSLDRYKDLKCIRFLATGWMCHRKNQESLIPIFNEIQKIKTESQTKLRDFEISFVGTPYSNEKYQHLRHRALTEIGVSKVNFYPMLPNDKILTLMENHHFVLIPSLGEALCFSALEMMSTGGIVISSDCEGSEDMLSHHENGFVIPRNAFSKWTKVILDLLDPDQFSTKKLTQMGQNAWKSVHDFSMHRYEQSLMKALKHPNAHVPQVIERYSAKKEWEMMS
jgi:GT2 family glycosyltransferase/glycosyltransferase involved in cell wall biosynthesis